MITVLGCIGSRQLSMHVVPSEHPPVAYVTPLQVTFPVGSFPEVPEAAGITGASLRIPAVIYRHGRGHRGMI